MTQKPGEVGRQPRAAESRTASGHPGTAPDPSDSAQSTSARSERRCGPAERPGWRSTTTTSSRPSGATDQTSACGPQPGIQRQQHRRPNSTRSDRRDTAGAQHAAHLEGGVGAREADERRRRTGRPGTPTPSRNGTAKMPLMTRSGEPRRSRVTRRARDQVRPPKRRARRPNSAKAWYSSSRPKSGQHIGVE